MATNVPAPKAPAKLATKAYIGDPSFQMNRKSTGPAAVCGGRKAGKLNMTPSMKMPANSGVKKA